MKQNTRTFSALSVLAVALLTACGGGGTSTPTSTTTSLSGTVIDGYIEGAEVCLDLDGSLTCNGSEPKATTIAGGTFKLDTTGLTTDQLKSAHLLTNVPTTAKDADDGGKTLAEADKSAFNLLAPASAYASEGGNVVTGAVISPLTTMVSHEMMASRSTLAIAEKMVRTNLSLTADADLRQDFVAKKDAALIEKAQMLAMAIAGVKAAALADTVTAPSEKQALFAALTYLQNQIADLQSAFDSAKSSAESGKTSVKAVDLVKTALKNATAKPVIADLVAEAKQTTDSSPASSVVAILEQGFYNASNVLETCGVNESFCIPNYWKILGTAGKLSPNSSYELSGSAWVKAASSSSSLVLTNAGWVDEEACSSGESITYSADSTGAAVVKSCKGSTMRATVRTVDANGKTLKALGLYPPTGFEGTTMPTGSQLHWFDLAYEQDNYSLYTGDSIGNYEYDQKTGRTSFVPITSLDAYLAAYATPDTGVTFTGRSGLHFSFNAGGTATGGMVTLWSPSTSSSPASRLGQASYVRRTVSNQEVLFITAPAPQNKRGDLVMFAVHAGKLYGGQYRTAGASSGTLPVFNKTMINAILSAGKKPPVLD